MADGKIQIDTEISLKDADKKLKDLTGKLKAFGKGSALIAGVTTAIKVMNKTIKETTTLYRTQATAEKQLEAAAKNNPYLNDSSVKALKDYAGYLQSISTVGDEQLLPLMAQLSAAGRTQTEIQDIMNASLDLSASGMMSLDSAVQQLNASYSGNVGMLGRQITELKNLSAEELKSGKAVSVIAEKYKGINEQVTKATGSSKQLSNAWGDLKEEIGATFERNLIPMRKFFTELIQGWTDAKKARREAMEAQEAVVKGTSNDLDTMRAQMNELQKQKNMYQSGMRSNLKSMGYTEEQIKNELKHDAEYIKLTNDLKNARDNLAKATKRVADEEENRKKQLEELKKNEDMDTRDALRAKYDETIRQAQEEIKQRRILGEEISKQEEAQEMLNVATDAYVKMMSDPAFKGNSGNYKHEEDARSQIAQWAEDAKTLPETENEFIEFSKKLKEMTQTEKEAKEEEIRLLDVEMDHLSAQDKLKVWDDYVKARKKLSDEITAIEEAEVKQQKEKTAEMITTINGYISQFADISNTMTNMLSKANEAQMNDQLTNISKQYTDGLIAYEEYCEKKDEISKQAAREQYKIDMWTWTASLLEATANIAQGVSKAIAQGGTYGIVTGALVAASGAAQIASIAASKPKTPSFATGGIVPGTSYTGDRVRANVNSGEMILNTAQQAQLWKMANGNSNGGGIKLNVDVTNNMGSEAKISQQITPRGLRITVDRIVNAGFKDGRYNNGLQAAQNISNGVSYL